MKLFILVILLALALTEAKKSSSPIPPSPAASLSPSSSAGPNVDVCASIPQTFGGWSITGETIDSWIEIEEEFQPLMNELGCLNGTLSIMGMPDDQGKIIQFAALVSQINLTYCENIKAFYHVATVFLPAPLPNIYVEALFVPIVSNDCNHAVQFEEIRKGDVETYGYPLHRLSVANGFNEHAQIGRDKFGNAINVVYNYYPNHNEDFSFSFDVTAENPEPTSYYVLKLKRIA